jgi:hypothetical protein
MSSFEPDDGFDALLRESMHGVADTVMPAGDGLSRIQQRVSARRARQRWLRPTLALGSAAAVAVVAVGAYAAVHNSGTDKLQTPPIATQPPPESPSVNPSPSPTPPPPAVAFPKRAIFPFTSAKDERAWEQAAAQGHSPWQGDPKAVATAWVANFLQLPSVNQIVKTISSPTKVDVQIGRMQNDASNQREITVTTVHLVKYGHAWIVTGASDDSGLLKIRSPKAGAVVTSPLTASGPGGGFHRAARVEVRDASTPTKYGEGNDGSFGSTQGWSASVSFQSPSNPVGVLLVVESSDADGLPIRVTAEQVRFGASSISAAGPYFYGDDHGRIAKFDASNGSFAGYVTPAGAAGVGDPQVLGDTLYYLTGVSSCGAHVESTPTAGGSASTVTNADSGYSIANFGVSQDQTKVAFFEMACSVSTSPRGKLVFADLTKQTRRTIDFQGSPPYVSSNPSWEPDGVHVDATVYTGTRSYVARYDSTSTTSPAPRNACPGYDLNNGEPWALETDPSGTIWFVTQTGSSEQVVRCTAGSQTATVAFTLSGKDVPNGTPEDVDVSPTGSVLVVDAASHVWEWSGSGDPKRLSLAPRMGGLSW